MTIKRIKELLSYYDEDLFTEAECEIEMFNLLLEPYLQHTRQGKPVCTFRCGSFNKILPRDYALYDGNAQDRMMYPLTIKNIVRIYWNKLCRKIGLTKLEWVW